MAGIYIHVPFCRQACHYCDFHFSTSLKSMDEMVKAMVTELRLKAERLESENVQTIYFGGGTPSLLSACQLEHILNTIWRYYRIDLREITLEANPDDISTPVIQDWKRLGINRLSIGIQSFQDEKLKWMNRVHTAAVAGDAVKEAQDSGIENISLDLIFNVPGSTEEELGKDIESLIALGPPHISAYNLTVEPQTVLGYRKKRGELVELDDEQAANQFVKVRKTLETNGYLPYEVSNFAKPGMEAVHNTNYWFQVPYIGIGPSAHGFINRTKSINLANNALYIKSLCAGQMPETTEEFSQNDLANEMILTRLRTKWGLNLVELKAKTGINLAIENLTAIGELKNRNLISQENQTLILTEPGILFADRVAMELML